MTGLLFYPGGMVDPKAYAPLARQLAEIAETSRFLPKATTWVRIEGGNHSQFGYIGTLLGDQQATISRAEQQDLTVSAILSMLNAVDQQRNAGS